MDSLLVYDCSFSSSEGEGEIEAEPRSKIPAVGETPLSVSVDSDHDLDAEASRRIGAEKATSEDSNAQADGDETIGSEGFHGTDTDHADESDRGEGSSKPDCQASGGCGNMPPLPTAAFTRKKNPYALKIADLNPIMRAFLSSVRKYFTQKFNLERQRAALCPSTYAKAQERILGFLGYVRSTMEGRELSPEVLLRVQLIEGYVEFLKEKRGCSAATVANHISSILYPIKFLHREDAPDFDNVAIIKQLRVQATLLQREGDLERPSSKEDFESQNRWLPWDQVVRAVATQRERFELAGPMKARARECCDLVLVSLYVFIPPSRGLEIRTLEVLADGEQFDRARLKDRNAMLMKDDGVVLYFHNYKTKRFSGRDELALQNDHELCHTLRMYVRDFRPHLTRERSGDFLLLNKNGDPFTAAAFSAHLKHVFFGLTGKLVSVNMLRSSFITWAYSQHDCTDALKSSLASALRHSTRQAQHTYDRRTANERKELAVNLAREFAEANQEDCGTATEQQQPCRFQPGDFVACVEETNAAKAPKIWLGQVRCLQRNGEVSLLWYKAVSGNLYKLELSGEPWSEKPNSLTPVCVEAAKTRPGLYRLHTSKRQIQKALTKV